MANGKYICIVCPIGCHLAVTQTGDKLVVSGNMCKRGEQHAINEHTNPKRMITTTVSLQNGYIRRLPVISTAEIPREKMQQCLKTLYAVTVSTPIQRGDVIVPDICDTGVNIVASRSIPKTNER